MDPLMMSAASGLRARMEALDLLANNLANAATAGYKADREFYGLYSGPEAESVLPVIERHWTDFATGTLAPTGNPLDLALAKRGFFVVEGPNGPLYTRNGGFRVANGVLATAEGYAVRGADGKPIRLDATRAVEVAPDGTVRQAGTEAGRIAVVDFASPQALAKHAGAYFRSAAAPAPAAAVEIQPGRLEASNVAVPEAAVRMVGILRQFEMLQKAIAIGGEMGRRSVEEVARVNP